ncbi:MAG: hypothetical protein QN174_13835 [Armatimonadota bacterium]|nr:hypothetical protein [Armatimonadota bacterium]MDR7421804.1 hypothetical protein [Armatimonadota bacterium]MDR7498024.1 hypothetical protein [Armatimonadota bacterium]MDR7510769.1 hypothetical protein [Armatimonadota bacterium]
MAKPIQIRISVRDGAGNVTVIDATGYVNEPPVIEQVIIDPPMVAVGSAARITVHARDPENEALSYEVVASEGAIERTDQPNVFIWRAA